MTKERLKKLLTGWYRDGYGPSVYDTEMERYSTGLGTRICNIISEKMTLNGLNNLPLDDYIVKLNSMFDNKDE